MGLSPSLSPAPQITCGIHSVCCSPNQEWLATGGTNPNHLALYHLPDFQPVALGTVSFHTLRSIYAVKHNSL